MSLSNNLAVARQLGKSMLLNGLDALQPGTALPLSDELVARPDFLNPLFSQYGLGEYRTLPGISSARLLDIQSISSNCNNRVMALEYSGDAGAIAPPATMFLKMPVTSLTTRLFFNVIMSWQLECQFYRNVAPRLPVRTPTAYAMANKGSRFIMLMENLHDDPTVVLHTNPEMMRGPSLDKTRKCLETLARIHAEFHGIGEAEREQLLPTPLQPFTSPVMRAITPMMATLALANCQKQPRLQLTPAHVSLYKKAVHHWDTLVDWWTREPLTLVHGDSHLGNHFLYGDDAGMLDWQAAQWAKGIRDVQYFLTDSLPADILAANEEALVTYYLAALADNGVKLGFDETWHQYRGFSFQTWMTIIVSLGFGAMTEDMDEVMPEIHRRCIDSIERLALGEWLDEVLGA
ncbi:MAG: phosphotransferase [Gammaproteobacteria bacterium]|nr:phosphotransferase [Gammaproteobacteria bacterium]